MAKISKEELAKRLGISPADLVPRDVAAQLLDRAEGSLANKVTADILPGFYNLSGKGVSGAGIFYRRDWIEDYRAWFALGRSKRNAKELRAALDAKIQYGALDLPEPGATPLIAQAHEPLSVASVVQMIERWKYRELHRRCEAVASREVPFTELMNAHRREASVLFDSSGSRRSLDDPNLVAALVEKAKEIVQPAGSFYQPEKLVSLMQTVWEHVLETERGWLTKARH